MTTLTDLFRTFGYIGLMSFGGPAAQIALMHRVLVEDRKWLTERDYLSALSFCMLLPGPEAMQLATWSGWRLHGTLGGLIAGLLFVLPGAVVVLALALATMLLSMWMICASPSALWVKWCIPSFMTLILIWLWTRPEIKSIATEHHP